MSAHADYRTRAVFDMDAPLAQAARCLDAWLEEEGRALHTRQRHKAAALIARYFLYEDCVTDALIMSFLRHYAGFRAIDMEDPTSVRHGLKTVLDQSVIVEALPPPSFSSRGYVWAAAVFLCLFFAALYFRSVPHTSGLKPQQQSALKTRVEKVTKLQGDISHAAVWAAVKEPFAVRSYKHLTVSDYQTARLFLDDWITRLEKEMPPQQQASLGARM